MAKAKTFEVPVTIVGTSGKPVEKMVKVTARATVGEVLKAAGIESLDKLNLSVDGKPATAEMLVSSKSKVMVTERPQGS
jgi:hypothetical protein